MFLFRAKLVKLQASDCFAFRCEGQREGDSPCKTSQNFHSPGHMGTWKVKCVISDKYKKEKKATDYIIGCIIMSFSTIK